MTAYFDEWSRLHGDYDVARSRLVRWWLAFVHLLARPLVRLGVSPNVVTAASVVAAAVALAASGSPLVTAGLVLTSVLLDGVDGAVAVRAGRVSPLGARLDQLADRVTDLLFVVTLARAGAAVAPCAVAAVAGLAFESVRAHARSTGQTGIVLVTVAERPMRVAIVIVALAASYDDWLVTAGAWLLSVLCAVGLVQFVVSWNRAACQGPRR